MTTCPYLLRGTSVFDDDRTNPTKEALVIGMTEMITRLTTHEGIPKAAKGFAPSFSDQPFYRHDVEPRRFVEFPRFDRRQPQSRVPSNRRRATPRRRTSRRRNTR